jgi:hypothetical protein
MAPGGQWYLIHADGRGRAAGRNLAAGVRAWVAARPLSDPRRLDVELLIILGGVLAAAILVAVVMGASHG